MHRFPSVFSFFLAISCVIAASAPSHATTTHVFYYTTYGTSTTTITTYTVNATTGIPTQVGSLTLNALFLSNIVPAPNDHFIYVQWADSNYNSYLSVYGTDANGAPQNTPVQQITAPGQFLMHSSGKYAYVLQTTFAQNEYSSTLYLYYVNQATGMLTAGPIQATYGPDPYYTESLVSINRAGTRLYDVWSMNFRLNDDYQFSYHPINTTTGQLSPDVGTIIEFSNYGGIDKEYFTGSYILNLHEDYTSPPVPSVLNVYKNVKNPKSPLFTCTQSMLNACGTAENTYWISYNQKYVFLPDSADNETVIAFIDGTSKTFTQTGSITGTPELFFSPDNQLIYGLTNNDTVQVYLFDAVSGTVTSGGSATGANGFDVIPADRK